MADLNAANRYIYAGDDPVNEVDPSGAWPFPFPTNCQVLGFAALLALLGILAAAESGGLSLLLTVGAYLVALYYWEPCVEELVNTFEQLNHP